jgi:hypothetical protein
MLEIINEHFTRQVLEHIVDIIENDTDGMDRMIKAGIDARMLDLMRQSKTGDLITVSRTQLRIEIRFDDAAISTSFMSLKAIREDKKLHEYFIIHGASVDLLSQYFRLPNNEIKRLRALLVPSDEICVGRPKMPHVELRSEICNEWATLEKADPSMHAKNRLHQLHQRYSSYPINSLENVLKEFDVDALKPKRLPDSSGG